MHTGYLDRQEPAYLSVLVAGGCLAWYGRHELRLRRDRGTSGHDPVVAVVSDWQHGLGDVVGRVGAAGFAGALLSLAFLATAGSLLTRRSRTAAVRTPGTGRPAEMVAGERG